MSALKRRWLHRIEREPTTLDVEGRPTFSQWEALHQAQARELHCREPLWCQSCLLQLWLGFDARLHFPISTLLTACEGLDGPCIRLPSADSVAFMMLE